MVIATEPSLPSGPPSAADSVAVSVASASETSVTAATVIASTAVAIAITNDNDHLRDGNNLNNCLHDG
jgi:hypothetical protein